MKSLVGNILFVDDNKHEHHLLEAALQQLELNNVILHAYDGLEAFNILQSVKEPIFAVISDINMPKVNGIELKRLIEGTPEIKLKAIPFIFHSSSASDVEVKEAYSLGIQGYFQKSHNLDETVENLRIIIDFWSVCVHPSRLK